MIAANELRIGNRFIRELHTSRGTEYDHEFVLTEEYMGKLFGNDLSIALQDLHPVILTPDVLDSLGFDVNSANQWSLGKVSISLPGINGYKNGRVYYNSWCIIEDCPVSLHRLQNIVHTLTGQELTIKL